MEQEAYYEKNLDWYFSVNHYIINGNDKRTCRRFRSSSELYRY